jgi:hypothetical protein
MKTIGTYTINDNQEDAAPRMFQVWLDGGTPYLTARTQSGKTSCLIELIRIILDYCIKENITPVIKYICLLADTNLRNQANKDIGEAFSGGYEKFSAYDLLGGNFPFIENMHHPDLVNFSPSKNTTVFTIFDEVQERTNKGGLFAKFCERMKNSEAIWFKAFSSATPYPYDLLRKKYSDLKKIILYPGPNHYSEENYQKDGRLRQGKKLFDGIELSKWAKDIFIPDCVEKCKNFGNGFVLVRNNSRKDQDKQAENLKQYMKINFNLDVETIFVNSAEGNINDLELLFKSKPNKLTFVFIRGALRAGKRLCKDYIRGVLDTVKVSNAAAMLQSLLGRLTGYDINNTSFNIYGDIKYVDHCIKYWHASVNEDKLLPVPSSRYNHSTVEEIKGNCDISFHHSKEDAIKRAKEIGIDTEADGWSAGAHISQTNAIDIARKILTRSLPSKNSPIYEIDGPNLVKHEHEKSWDDLLAEHGKHIKNLYVLFEPCSEKIIGEIHKEPNETFVRNNRTLSDLN